MRAVPTVILLSTSGLASCANVIYPADIPVTRDDVVYACAFDTICETQSDGSQHCQNPKKPYETRMLRHTQGEREYLHDFQRSDTDEIWIVVNSENTDRFDTYETTLTRLKIERSSGLSEYQIKVYSEAQKRSVNSAWFGICQPGSGY